MTTFLMAIFMYFIFGLSLERLILEARPKPNDHADYGQIHIIHGLLV